MKTLDQYLTEKKAKEGLTEQKFGDLVGLSQSRINRLRRGVARPSWETVNKIHEVTDGVVSPAAFFPQAAE